MEKVCHYDNVAEFNPQPPEQTFYDLQANWTEPVKYQNQRTFRNNPNTTKERILNFLKLTRK